MESEQTPTPSLALRVSNVSVRFGGLKALENVSFEVARGEIVGIIGPNGAGKSTLLNAISGLQRLAHGFIELGGVDVTNEPAHRRAARGLGRTFQTPSLLMHADVLSNVMLARHSALRATAVGNLLASPRTRRDEREARRAAEQALGLLGGQHLAHRHASELSHGDQRVVELARAIVMRPSVLLLDEPTSGMTLTEREEVGALLRRISDETNAALIVIEHDVAFVRAMCRRAIVLDFGRVLAHGTVDDVLRLDAVRAGYLGQFADD